MKMYSEKQVIIDMSEYDELVRKAETTKEEINEKAESIAKEGRKVNILVNSYGLFQNLHTKTIVDDDIKLRDLETEIKKIMEEAQDKTNELITELSDKNEKLKKRKDTYKFISLILVPFLILALIF